MATNRKLGKTTDQRLAMLKCLSTDLILNGKIETTLARAKEVKKIAEGLIALAVKEKDNFETVKVTAKVAKKDAEGKRVKEVVDGKKVTVYEEVEKEIKKDKPSRLHARRQMLKVLYNVTEVPTAKAGKKNGCLIEGMACPGGCVAGAGTNIAIPAATKELLAFKENSKVKLPKEDLRQPE